MSTEAGRAQDAEDLFSQEVEELSGDELDRLFMEFVLSGEYPEGWPEGLEFSELEIEQLRERLEYGLGDQIVANLYQRFCAARAPQSSVADPGLVEMEGFDDDAPVAFVSDVPEDDAPSAASVFDDLDDLDAMSGADALDRFAEFEPSGMPSELDDFDDPEELLRQQAQEQRALHDTPDVPGFNLPSDDDFQQPPASVEVDDTAPGASQDEASPEDAKPSDQPTVPVPAEEQKGSREAGEKPSPPPLTDSAKKGGAALYNAAAALAAGTAALAAWGLNHVGNIPNHVQRGWQGLNNRLDAMREKPASEAQQDMQNWRDANLQGHIAQARSVIEQMNEVRDDLLAQQVPGWSMSLQEGVEQYRDTNPNPARDSILDGLKEFVKERTVDALCDEMQSMVTGCERLKGHVEHITELADRLGLSPSLVDSQIVAPIAEKIEEFEEYLSIMDVLDQVGFDAEEDPAVPHDDDGLREKMAEKREQLRKALELVGQYLSRLLNAAGPGVESGPSPM